MIEFLQNASLFIWGLVASLGGLLACFEVPAEFLDRENDNVTYANVVPLLLLAASLLYTGIFLLSAVFGG